MDIKDAKQIEADEAEYSKVKAWRERQEAEKREKMKQKKDEKAKAKDKLSKDQWEHLEKQAQVRQQVQKVQGFDDAIASMIEQESMGDKIRPGAAGEFFKRLDVNKNGILERGESEEIDGLLNQYAAREDQITFEQFKRGVRKAMKRHAQQNTAMREQGIAASHLGR